MPKTTFQNLPEEKRRRILAAISREIARVPFEDTSINRIVQDAGIPRGSFYQYFEDRDDLFQYMFLYYQHQTLRVDFNYFLNYTGSAETVLCEVFGLIAKYGTVDTVDARALRNMYLYMGSGCHTMRAENSVLMNMVMKVGRRLLGEPGEDEFRAAVEMIYSIFRESMVGLFNNLDDIDSIVERFRLKMHLLFTGLNKAKETGEKATSC